MRKFLPLLLLLIISIPAFAQTPSPERIVVDQFMSNTQIMLQALFAALDQRSANYDATVVAVNALNDWKAKNENPLTSLSSAVDYSDRSFTITFRCEGEAWAEYGGAKSHPGYYRDHKLAVDDGADPTLHTVKQPFNSFYYEHSDNVGMDVYFRPMCVRTNGYLLTMKEQVLHINGSQQ